MAIGAVLFDLDRTLWRVEHPPDWEAITRLQAVEIAADMDRLGLAHVDRMAFIRRFWADFAAADARPTPTLEEVRGAAVIQATLAAYGVACGDGDGACLWDALHTVPFRQFNISSYPDAVATVEALSQAGYRLAIVTSRPLTATIVAREIRAQGLPDVFEAVVTSGEVGYRKPHPLVFTTALDRLGLRADEAVLVGDDYELDVVPAAQLGMLPILKLNEREPSDRWTLARYQVPTLSALLELDIFRR